MSSKPGISIRVEIMSDPATKIYYIEDVPQKLLGFVCGAFEVAMNAVQFKKHDPDNVSVETVVRANIGRKGSV